MRIALRFLLALLGAAGLTIGVVGGAHTAHAGGMYLHIFYQDRPTRLLTPGIDFVAVAQGSVAPADSYCLGMASLRDRYGLPVSLGAFHLVDGGIMAVQASIPARVFPAEPIGPFLLFVGRCTDVAPDGIFGSAMVTIVPAAG